MDMKNDDSKQQYNSNFHNWFLRGIKYLESEKYICANIYCDEDEFSCELVGTDKLIKDEDGWNFDENKVYERKNPFVICKSDISAKEIIKCFKNTLNRELKNPQTKKLLNGKILTYGLIDGELFFANSKDNYEKGI